jgi:hypothetical protein
VSIQPAPPVPRLLQVLRPAPAPGACPQHPRWGRFSSPFGVGSTSPPYAGAAPCTRAGGQPPAPPLGPFHFPKPLEIQVFFSAAFPSIMPLLAPAAEELLPIGAESFPHSATWA